jgi:prefoldin subunit 5
VSEIRVSEKRIKETESAVEAGEGLSALLGLQSAAMELSLKVDRLNKLSASIVACEKTLEKTKSLAEVAEKLEVLGKLKHEKFELDLQIHKLSAFRHTLSKLDKIISDKKAISEINILEKLKEFDYLYKQVQAESQKLESLKQIKTKLRKYKVIIEDAAQEELKLKNEFPSQCPLCGSSFGECKD